MQIFSLTREGQIRTEIACLSYRADGDIPMEMPCDPDAAKLIWTHSKVRTDQSVITDYMNLIYCIVLSFSVIV